MSLFLLLMVVVAAFSIELSNLYLMKLQVQRTADLANLAAGTTPAPLVGTTVNPIAKATAANVAALNGMGSAAVETTGQTYPGARGGSALVTNITQDIPLSIGRILSDRTSFSVGGQSWLTLNASTSGDCIRSLIGPVNITDSAVVKGPDCKLNSATYLYLCGSSQFAFDKVAVKYTRLLQKILLCNSASLSPAAEAFEYGVTGKDSLAADQRVLAIKNRLLTMGSPGWPFGHGWPAALLNPSVPGSIDNRIYAALPATVAGAAHIGTLTAAASTIRFAGSGAADPNCTNPTTVAGKMELSGITNLTFASGCYVFAGQVKTTTAAKVAFRPEPGASVTFVFKGEIYNDFAELSFGDASLSIAGAVNNMKGGAVRFGDGRVVSTGGILNGSGSMIFGNGPFYFNAGSIMNTAGTLIFGKGPFNIWGGGVVNSYDGTITFGDGHFTLYGGSIINNAGVITFGNGAFDVYGGSVSLYAKTETSFGVGDVNLYGGSITASGKSLTFGRGGSASAGSGGVFFYGGSFLLTAGNLTALGTTFAFSGGSISLNGTGTIAMTAPTAGTPGLGYRDILVYVQGGAFYLWQTAAVTDTLAGIIYGPISIASFSSKSIVRRPDQGCFQVVAGFVNIFQNADLDMSPCSGAVADTAAQVKLVR